MTQTILIVDDDKEFNQLLKEVYQQAQFRVVEATSADEAEERLEEHKFDLVVTDNRMPGRSGVDLIESILEKYPKLPIIMISGHLENGVIRHLISRGVGGIFMKPLNVFSLLKKTTELIGKNEAERESEEAASHVRDKGEASLPFPFSSFPCVAEKSREFAHRLYEMRNFSRNLLLIAHPGVALQPLVNDLAAMSEQAETGFLLPPDEIETNRILDVLSEALEAGHRRVTLAIPSAETLSVSKRALLQKLTRKETPFDIVGIPHRFLFVLSRELDHYYDQGLIDEEYYIFLGSAEIRVPLLDEMKEDIPFLADAILSEVSPGRRFEDAARADLAHRSWPGHVEQLRSVIERVAHWSRGGIITSRDLRSLLEGGGEDAQSLGELPLARYLSQVRNGYQRALGMLQPHISDPIHSGEEGRHIS